MNKLTISLILAGVSILSACKKHSSGGGAAPPAVDTVVIYSPGLHMLELRTFQFDGPKLEVYSDFLADTGTVLTQTEAIISYFSYDGSRPEPVSVRITDTADYVGSGQVYESFPIGFDMLYDNRGRLIEDTANTGNGYLQNWYFVYSRDSDYIYQYAPGPSTSPREQFAVTGGNMSSYREQSILSRAQANPMYDPTIAQTYALQFLTPNGFVQQIGYFILPVDFLSQQLPLLINDIGDATQLGYNWETDPAGRVTGGVVSGYPGGPVVIQFKYSTQ